jgi:hypothetical protein
MREGLLGDDLRLRGRAAAGAEAIVAVA